MTNTGCRPRPARWGQCFSSPAAKPSALDVGQLLQLQGTLHRDRVCRRGARGRGRKVVSFMARASSRTWSPPSMTRWILSGHRLPAR
jgi:hypothetical protein